MRTKSDARLCDEHSHPMQRVLLAAALLVAPSSALLLSTARRPLTSRRCASPLLASEERENQNEFSVDWDRQSDAD